jgi:hypothetical protein
MTASVEAIRSFMSLVPFPAGLEPSPWPGRYRKRTVHRLALPGGCVMAEGKNVFSPEVPEELRGL